MGEPTRTLKLGGYLLITVHGFTRLHQLTPEQRDAFEAGGSCSDTFSLLGSESLRYL